MADDPHNLRLASRPRRRGALTTVANGRLFASGESSAAHMAVRWIWSSRRSSSAAAGRGRAGLHQTSRSWKKPPFTAPQEAPGYEEVLTRGGQRQGRTVDRGAKRSAAGADPHRAGAIARNLLAERSH